VERGGGERGREAENDNPFLLSFHEVMYLTLIMGIWANHREPRATKELGVVVHHVSLFSLSLLMCWIDRQNV
jgi:hypothetical protein